MTKRLQVLLDDEELAEIRDVAHRQHMTVAEWVRQALRAARREQPRHAARLKSDALERAARHSFPAGDIDQMLAEIERGYAGRRR